MTVAWDWVAAGDAVLPVLRALGTTLLAGLAGFTLAALLGLPLALGRDARHWAIRLPVAAGIEFVRGTPLLIQVYALYFMLPAAGLVLPAMLTGVGALGVHYATYVSEVYRAGHAAWGGASGTPRRRSAYAPVRRFATWCYRRRCRRSSRHWATTRWQS